MVANDAMELARMCARAADDAKAENVRVYDLRGMSSLTDFMVVCTGLSVPHLRAVIRELEEAVREKAGALPTYVEDTPVALWSVVDYIDVMVHIMGQETRDLRHGHSVEGCSRGGVLTRLSMPEFGAAPEFSGRGPVVLSVKEYWGGEELRYQAGVSEVSREGVPNG